MVVSDETGLEVNADKTKYMIISVRQNAGRRHSIKFDDSSLERVQDFKYFGTTYKNQNFIQEKFKSRLKSSCYQSDQNLLSFCLLSTVFKVKIYRTTILPVVLIGWEIWSLTLC